MVYFKVLPSTRIELSPPRPWLAPPCRLSAQPSVVQFKDENPFSHSRAPSLASLPTKPHRMIDLDKLSSELELKSSLYTFYMERIKHQWSSDSSISSERLGREHLPNLSSSLHTAT